MADLICSKLTIIPFVVENLKCFSAYLRNQAISLINAYYLSCNTTLKIMKRIAEEFKRQSIALEEQSDEDSDHYGYIHAIPLKSCSSSELRLLSIRKLNLRHCHIPY